MATTVLGYVTGTFAGRAGLFTATLLPTNGGAPIDVQISDLDGEPERFNERLTKTRLLREAMSRAEPVVVVYERADAGGNELESVHCLTRHHAWIGQRQDDYVGIVVGVSLREQVDASAHAEASDIALITLLDPVTGASRELQLALQRPERQVMEAMLRELREARDTGEPLAIRCMTETQKGDDKAARPAQWISWVERADLKLRQNLMVDGFVEAITLQTMRSTVFGRVTLTTAPPFVDVGGVVDPSSFKPTSVQLYVAQRSPMLPLFEQALNAGQRMRVTLAEHTANTEPFPSDTPNRPGATNIRSLAFAAADLEATDGPSSADPTKAQRGIAVAALLLAPLASQARPVWVRVKREALDQPPPGMCGGPVPTSDLSPVNVASLQVPHRAAWEGCGCFNRGIYRIQVVSAAPVRMLFDGKELNCVFALPLEATTQAEAEAAKPLASDKASLSKAALVNRQELPVRVYLGHVCVEDCHTLRIEVDEWRCGHRFELDVMKLR